MINKDIQGRRKVIIEQVLPQVEEGRYAVKRVIGEKILVTANIFTDGHDAISGRVLFKKVEDTNWQEAIMEFLENDCWKGEFRVESVGRYVFTVEAWVDKFSSWMSVLKKKHQASQDLSLEFLIGSGLIDDAAKKADGNDKKKLMEWSALFKSKSENKKKLTLVISKEFSSLVQKYPDRNFATRYEKELGVVVDRDKARFSSWYEMFPRSVFKKKGKKGNFKDFEELIPKIAEMGFDVLYLPPVHPIGETKRKGKNNAVVALPDDVGSPWAIGSRFGGHKAIHPELGDLKDFQKLVRTAKEHNIEIALDLAYQCSPDHPYVSEHPEWFLWDPDGTVKCAENPPKKYEDIIPFNFKTDDWKSLWEELKSIVEYWIDKGINIFRVDNPHTKPFVFWEWLINEVKSKYPDVLFLAEAFTRPKVMYRLGKLGFTQSYTYFTWRSTKKELIDYLKELTATEVKEFFRPNFWPNTPDILPEHLQYGGRPAFLIRAVLAGTLSSNYGLYSPAFDLCISEALEGREEYFNSEKYEIKNWDLEVPHSISDFLAQLNAIRRDNAALQETNNIKFYETDNEYLLFYGKTTEDLSNLIMVVVNLDPYHKQVGWVKMPIKQLGIDEDKPYLAHDLIGGGKYVWHGEWNYVELDPQSLPFHILKIKIKLKRESDFDYFM
ncbi:MAG: alpha-1,4-glucan--maltose-1-phosphate maltosyltransferase [bacterium]